MIRALAAVGTSHALAWAVPAWVVLSQARWIGGASGHEPGGPLLGVLLLAWIGLVLGAGAVVAGRRLHGRRGARRGLLALWAGLFAALALASLAAATAPVLTLPARPPLAGVAIGVQVAVLLPGGGRRRRLARAATPVTVDLASAALATAPAGVAGGLAAAPAWLALALALVATLELLHPPESPAPASSGRRGGAATAPEPRDSARRPDR